jgi:hypothetical protein
MCRRAGHAGIDIDHISGIQRRAAAVTLNDAHIGKGGEIGFGASRESYIWATDLDIDCLS